MREFAALLDKLVFDPSRNGKLRLMADFFRHAPDPERGWALAALTGSLSFRQAKPALIRTVVMDRVDPVLFAMSYDYVGDLSETVALIWPVRPLDDPGPGSNGPPLALSDVVATLAAGGRVNLQPILTRWLDELDETARWALLKLVTGGLRVGVSARLAKTSVAMLGDVSADDVEQVWHGLVPPYRDLFAWVEGFGAKPVSHNPAPFRPPMLSHPIDEADFATLDPADFSAEWKWDGIRLQAAAGPSEHGSVLRLYSRTGEEVTGAFPDLAEALAAIGGEGFAIDGELLVVREGTVRPFGELQQRLNRKSVGAKQLAAFPAHLRAYDLLAQGSDDLRALPFDERRRRLEAFVTAAACPRLDLSALVPFENWEQLGRYRADPASAGAGDDATAVEGLMLKRRDSVYVAGRPTGPWWKWKRAPYSVDAVMMYAQRGSGKRSSFYSDYTFGVWKGEGEAAELVPVGKAYSGFTDQELVKLDRYVRHHTRERFGPVRVVEHGAEIGLVLEVAFEGLNRSTRHKSGIAMRFPRIARIRWDKPSAEADRIEFLEKLLA